MRGGVQWEELKEGTTQVGSGVRSRPIVYCKCNVCHEGCISRVFNSKYMSLIVFKSAPADVA